jgi:hypothetical protein
MQKTDGADWTDAARIVLHIDSARQPKRARRAWESHLRCAKWMIERGYRNLLSGVSDWLSRQAEELRARQLPPT